MNQKKLHILIAYLFNAVLIVLSFLMMQSYYDSLQIIFLILSVLYIVYWIISSRKNYMPWVVYINFGVGVLAQILLNCCGIIPKDGGWFSGLGQYFYVVFVVVHAVLVGFINLILFLIHRKKGVVNRGKS